MKDCFDYNELYRLGYGEHYELDDNGNVIGDFCVHYYDLEGICVFCGDIKYKSLEYCRLYGCDMCDY